MDLSVLERRERLPARHQNHAVLLPQQHQRHVRALQVQMDRSPVGLCVAAHAQVRRLRRAREDRRRQRRIRQRARLGPGQPRRRSALDHVGHRRARNPQTAGNHPVAGARRRQAQDLSDVMHLDLLSALHPSLEGDDHAGRTRDHPIRVAELILESVADVKLECPAELTLESAAELRRIPHLHIFFRTSCAGREQRSHLTCKVR